MPIFVQLMTMYFFLSQLAEEQTSRQIEEVDEFEKLLSRLEAEFSLRERVHYVVFGIISNAQHALDIQERFKIGKEVPGYVQEQRQRGSQEIVATAISTAKEEYKQRASLRDTAREIVTAAIDSAFQRALRDGQALGPKKDTVAESISENLFECAKDVVTVAIMSACRHRRGDHEISAAKSLAADAVLAAKASLEKLYGTTCELDAKDQVDTHEISCSLDICAKEVAAAAIISATRSFERTYFKHDSNMMAARSLALDAVAAAKASLENFLGVIVEFEEEDVAPSTDISACLAESAKNVAEAFVTSSSQLLSPTKTISKTESRVAQSLANDAIQAAVASIQNLYGVKVDFEDESEEAVIGIAATAIISATQSMEKDSEKRDFDLTIAARELANSAMDSAKASISWFQRESVAPGSKEDALRIFSSLDEAVKRIAEVAVESATRSLQRIAEENERDLTYTTRELVTNVLNSAKASIETLYGIKIEPEIELLPPSKEICIMSSASESLEQILDVKEREVELMVAARNLASNALQAAEASLQRLYCIANEIESNIENAALDISKSLVDSSRNLRQRLGKEGLGTAARELACRAIESASKSIAKLHGEETSLQEKVESDSCLLKAAAKVTTISVRASSGELFDRGFIGGSELEEATGHMASHAVRSAEAMLAQVQESSSTVDLDLQICKAAFELASQVVVSAEDSVARLVQQNQSVATDPGSDHGQLFWKVSTYVESLINGALRRLGSVGYFNDDTDDPEDYELISHSEALQADAEYCPHVQDFFQREKLSLKASRIVNDVVENAKEIVRSQMKNTPFFFAPDVQPGRARFTRRRSSSVHFNEGSLFHSRRDSYVPRETDFLSVVNRPPTPRFRKARVQSISQELQEVDKELCSPSDSDLNILEVTDTGLVQRRVSGPGQGINCEKVSVPEQERSASDSTLFFQNQSSTVTEKPSLYDIIKKREECASCEISPCGSYVVLPHLNPSECSLIAACVESYEALWKQKKSTTSVTCLPSLSPKGSFVAGEGVQHVSQHQESHNRTTPSSSRLPNITNSTSKISQRSSSESSLKQSSGQPKRTSSMQITKSLKPSPQSSKESAKLPSKPSARKGSLSKMTTSRDSLRTKEKSGHSFSRSEIALTQKSLVRDKHSNVFPTTRNETGSSLTRASSSSRALTETATRSKTTVPQNKLKSPPKTSILFALADSGKAPSGPSFDKSVKALRVSTEKMSLPSPQSTEDAKHSSRTSSDNEMPFPRVSREAAILSSKTSTRHTFPSSCNTKGAEEPSVQQSTLNTGSASPGSKEKVTQSPHSSTENAVLSSSSSKAKVAQSLRATSENALLPPTVSKRKVKQSPSTSTKKVVLPGSVSKGKITLSPRPSTEVAMISSRAMKGKVSNFPRASINKAVLSAQSSKEKVTQSQSMFPDNAGLASQFSVNDITPSPRTSSVKAPSSTSLSGEKVAQSPNTSAQDNEKKTEVCPRASTETTLASPKDLKIAVGPQGAEVSTSNTVAILPQTVTKTSCQSASSFDLQETMKKAKKSEMVLKGSTSSGEHLRKELSCSARELEKASENENIEKNLTSLPPTSLKKHLSQPERASAELDRTDGDPAENKESEMIRSTKNVVPSLERIIQDKRLTPEGAEAETRPASSADILAARKSVDPEGIRGNITVQQVLSRSARPSLSKSLSSAAKSSSVGVIMNQQSSRSSQEVRVSKPSDEDKAVTTRKKPEGEDRSEVQGVSSGAVGESSDKSSKMFVSSSPEIVSFPGTNKELVSAPKDVIKVEGYPTYRKVSISRSIHDTVNDIVQQMLRTTDEPTAIEGTGPRKEIKKDTGGNLGASSMFDQQRKFPSGKVSKTVIDTVDLMLQSVSASDERKPRYSLRRKISGSDIVGGIGE